MTSENIAILDVINTKINEIISPTNKIDDIFIPTYVPKKYNKKILVLSGGGIRGISFIGSLYALHEIGILQCITTYAGTSVGALILFLIVLGYTPAELFEFIKVFDLNKLKSVSVSLFLDSFGLDSGDKIIKTLSKFATSKGFSKDVNFIELFEKTKKTFIITAVNVSKQTVEYFSHTTHPTMSVIHAVRMSISIPFIFTPTQYNGCMYIDGGCIDNFPLKQFHNKKDELIGIYVSDVNPVISDNKTFDEYAMNVIYSVINGITETSVKGYEDCTICISINDTNSIDFDITHDKKIQLFNIGRKNVHDYMNNVQLHIL